jgi:putative resolvase
VCGTGHGKQLTREGAAKRLVIEHLLQGYGVRVVYTGQPGDGSAAFELVWDMLAVVASVAGRLYGQRSAKTRRLRAAVAAQTNGGDGA